MSIQTLPFEDRFGHYDLTLSVETYSNNKRLGISLLCLEDGDFMPYAVMPQNKIVEYGKIDCVSMKKLHE